ncbi:hypothetical protein WJX82_010161 [Trebouxia sp. C0006]
MLGDRLESHFWLIAAYQSLSKSVVLFLTGTSLMEEVFINQETDAYVLEVDGRLDLAALQLQPASIVINSKKGLVDAQTSKTKRTFADIQHKVLHDTSAGSKANPLNVSGAFVPVTDKSKKRRLPSDRPGVGRNSTPDLALLAPHGLAFLAEFKLGLDDKAQPQALRYFEQLWEETWPKVLNQSFAATFIIEMMGAGLRIGGAAWGDRIYYEALTPKQQQGGPAEAHNVTHSQWFFEARRNVVGRPFERLIGQHLFARRSKHGYV